MSDIIKFTTPQHRHLKDYGYDLKARQVISFKNTINGHQLLRRTTYNINGAQISHTAIHNSAVAEAACKSKLAWYRPNKNNLVSTSKIVCSERPTNKKFVSLRLVALRNSLHFLVNTRCRNTSVPALL